MNSVDTRHYRGYEIQICIDEDPVDPRTWSNLGTMFCFHNRYNLGDDVDIDSSMFGSWNEMKDYIVDNYNPVVIKPLSLLDHSGLSIKIGTSFREDPGGWDSGQVGFIIASEEDVDNSGLDKIEQTDKIENVLRREVKIYDDYIRGNVYGYYIPEVEDSLWGFYGSDLEENRILDEAKSSIDYHIETKRKEKQTKLKHLINNGVSLNKRESIIKEVSFYE